ncbi:hypothetical protein SteCoe_6848 [Stentor coeruleus]|uniref:Peptidase A1 domain-containing protein n=1 Tax=Stentor coeruleus TaxID=5963 RepID=A0A1R2CP39_9CILI|nr:hypothetical protein SteCoe_6848 [Stentor coeruleus]
MELLTLLLLSSVSGLVHEIHPYPELEESFDSAPILTVTPVLKDLIVKSSGDAYYTVVVTLGNPGKDFTLLIDTASKVSWVQGPKCETKVDGKTTSCFKVKNYYDPNKSKNSTIIYNTTVYTDEYGNMASGPLYRDYFTIGGFQVMGYFAAANNISSKLPLSGVDGILGLAYQPIGKGPQSILNLLKINNFIPSATFGLFLADTHFMSGIDSKLTLGGANFSYTNTTSAMLPVTVTAGSSANNFWQFQAHNIDFGNINLANNTMVTIDTTDYAVVVPPSVYSVIWQVLKSTGFEMKGLMPSIRCSSANITSLPSFYIAVNWTTYITIPSYRWLRFEKLEGVNTTCYAYILNSTDNNFYLGDSLLKHYYTEFSIDFQTLTFLNPYNPPPVNITIKKSSSDDDNDLAGWAIALIVIFSVVGVLAIGAIVWFIIKRRKHSSDESQVGKSLQEVSLHA